MHMHAALLFVGLCLCWCMLPFNTLLKRMDDGFVMCVFYFPPCRGGVQVDAPFGKLVGLNNLSTQGRMYLLVRNAISVRASPYIISQEV